jgi:hypothetical protein
LFDEEALLAAAGFSAADFVAGITGGRIGIEAFLLSATARRPDAGFRLAKRGIVLPSGF